MVLAVAIVGVALPFRQKADRSATDAWLPMRTLTPHEAAALLVAEENRSTNHHAGTLVERLTPADAVLLTRWYVIETAAPDSPVPESYSLAEVGGRHFELVSGSWENCVSRYRVPREPLQRLVPRPLAAATPAERTAEGFGDARVSFSSDLVWLYFVAEVLLIALALVAFYAIFARAHVLLWLPLCTALQLSMMIVVALYSPAFLDADFFHQRIVIEDLLLVLIAPLDWLGGIGIHLLSLSLLAYVLLRLGRLLEARKIVALRRYVIIVSGIAALGLSIVLIAEAFRYAKQASAADRLIAAVRDTCTPTRIQPVMEFLERAGLEDHENFVKGERAPEEVRTAVRDVLAPRRAGDPILRVLIPFRNRYIFLWANDAFTYADVRPLESAGGVIGDYECIQPAVESCRSWRTGFGHYLWNRLEGTSSETLHVTVTTNEAGAVAAVIVAGVERSH